MFKKCVSFSLSVLSILFCFSSMLTAYAGTKFVVVYDSEGNICERFGAVAPFVDESGATIEYGQITNALEDAFLYCEENGDNCNYHTITVPEGEYVITKTINPSSYTTLVLDNETVLVNSPNGLHNIFATKPEQSGYTGLIDFTLSGGVLKYHSDNSSEGSLLRLSHALNVKIKNVKFLDNINSHHAEVAGCRNVEFSNCLFSGQSGNASSSSSEALQIDVLNEQHFPFLGDYDGTINDGITVKNCTFKNLVRGVGTHTLYAGYYQNHINILNNTFENIQSTAISCYGFINSKIDSNKITSSGEGIRYHLMLGDTSLSKVCPLEANGNYYYGKANTNCNTKITNNTISVKRTTLTAYALPINVFGNNITTTKTKEFPSADYKVSNVEVSGNKITTDAYGIRLYDVKNSKINKNTVKSTKKYYSGISLSDASSGNEVKSNTITNFENAINDTGGSKNTYSSNKISSPSKNGILVQKSAKNAKIKSNTISSCGTNGVQLLNDATTDDITSNKITGCKKNGILVTSKSKAVNISSNTITSCSENGIAISSNSTVKNIKSNTASSNTKQGLYIAGCVSTILSNTFKTNKKYGMYFESSSKVTTLSSNQLYSKNKSGNAYSRGSSKSYKFGNLATPSVTLSSKSKEANIKWKKVANASKYEIYRSTSANGTFSKIATIDAKKTSYVNKKLATGKTYFYKIRAVRKMNGITEYSKYSSSKSIKIK